MCRRVSHFTLAVAAAPPPPANDIQNPDRSLCSDLQRMAELRPKVFREPELLEAVGEVLTGKGAKTAIQSSGGREAPCVAQAAACAMLNAALKVQRVISACVYYKQSVDACARHCLE